MGALIDDKVKVVKIALSERCGEMSRVDISVPGFGAIFIATELRCWFTEYRGTATLMIGEDSVESAKVSCMMEDAKTASRVTFAAPHKVHALQRLSVVLDPPPHPSLRVDLIGFLTVPFWDGEEEEAQAVCAKFMRNSFSGSPDLRPGADLGDDLQRILDDVQGKVVEDGGKPVG